MGSSSATWDRQHVSGDVLGNVVADIRARLHRALPGTPEYVELVLALEALEDAQGQTTSQLPSTVSVDTRPASRCGARHHRYM
jgi:hypothetical protein